jgi:hypothetical protein
MTNSTRQPGLDGRHRNQNGRTSEKHGNTRVGTLRDIYGDGFASDFRSDARRAPFWIARELSRSANC